VPRVPNKNFVNRAKNISEVRRISFESANIRFKPVDYSKHCRRVWEVSSPGKFQFSRQSRASLAETLEHMVTAFDENYITKTVLAEVNKDYKECLRQLNGYIKYLKTAKEAGKINNK
jgi:23S rRNA-intervening sequence protein